MSKSIQSYPKDVQKAVAHKREQSGTMGLGYWGARDALKKIAEKGSEKS